MRTITRYTIACAASAAALCLPRPASAQQERADIRRGNRAYYEGKYPEAEVGYKRAIEKNINSYEANFNLGGALYKQGRYDDAAATYLKLGQDGTDRNAQSQTFYNLGNTYLQQRKLDEAIEAYKNALRINPGDTEAKFNLAYAKKLKQEEENEDQNDDQNDDGGGGGGGDDPNDDQNNGGDGGGGGGGDNDQNDDPNDSDRNNDGGQNDRQQQSGEQPDSPSREESERLLRAIQAGEDNTKRKVDEQRATGAAGRGGKQW